MRRVVVAAMLVAICSAVPAAQEALTNNQRDADLVQLASWYAKNYAPYEWKRDVIGFDLYRLTPWLKRVHHADDLDFQDALIEYVASLNDAHSTISFPSNFSASLGLTVDIYDGKVLIDSVNRLLLPVAQYPFDVGDELVSLDGQSVQTLIASFRKYATAANTRSTDRLAANLITRRSQSIVPHAPDVGDMAVASVRLAATGTRQQLSDSVGEERHRPRVAGAGAESELTGVWGQFPQYRGREGEIGTLEERINGCMERSMNGRMLPLDGLEMKAFLAYTKWLSTGIPDGAKLTGAGTINIKEPDRAADLGNGAKVYAGTCAACHGEDGRGQRAATGSGYQFSADRRTRQLQQWRRHDARPDLCRLRAPQHAARNDLRRAGAVRCGCLRRCGLRQQSRPAGQGQSREGLSYQDAKAGRCTIRPVCRRLPGRAAQIWPVRSDPRQVEGIGGGEEIAFAPGRGELVGWAKSPVASDDMVR